MIAAIYARKSTEQNGVGDEAKSVTRQVEHARAFAAGKGWTVAEEHVYVDDGISGAEFSKRPGFLRLMNTLKPRAPFQILVMSEESRLGREQIEVAYALKQFAQAGVRVWLYLAGEERRLESAVDKMMAALTGFAAEIEREKAAQRTRDALERKARAGQVTGGRVFGYDNVRAAAGAVTRVVNEPEAAIVRRIFALAAQGVGFKRIAATLNEEGAKAPVPKRAGRPRGWAPSTIREIIHRELYRGQLVWGRTKKRDAWGQMKASVRPAADWIRREAPELRVVPEGLWRAVHERLAASRRLYVESAATHPGGRPASGIESRYLLTGLGACGACGGSMFVHTRSHRHYRVPFFGCMTYHLRGRAVCANNLEVRLEAADQAVLDAVERDVLRVEVLETALAKAVDLLRPPAEASDTRAQALRAELVRLEAELGRLAAAIAAGGELGALVTALTERERRREQVSGELARLERERRGKGRTGFDVERIVRDLRARLADWQGLLRQEVAQARPALRALLAGRLVFTAHEEAGGSRYYEFSGPGTVRTVIEGLAFPKGVVAPTGIEPVSSP